MKLLPSLIRATKQETVLNVEFVHLSKEEKAARKAAREAEARKGGKGRKGTGKRKRDDSSDEDNSDSDREYL